MPSTRSIHQNSWLSLGRLFLLLNLLLFLMVACGRRTPPKPEQETQVIHDFSVRQIHEELRFSWQIDPEQAKAKELAGFELHIYSLESMCPTCEPILIRQLKLPFPSNTFKILDNRVYLSVPAQFDLKGRQFELQPLDSDDDDIGSPFTAGLSQFVRIPTPPRPQWSRIKPGAMLPSDQLNMPEKLLNLADVVSIKISWQLKVSQLVFRVTPPNPPVQTPEYYRTNVYRKIGGDQWTPLPLNKKPLSDDYYIDFIVNNDQNYEYQIRFVDTLGNESAPSPVLTLGYSNVVTQ